MARLRFDGVAGALSTALGFGSTVMDSEGLSTLGVVSGGDVAAVTLYKVNGFGRVTAIETLAVTAHAEDATTATVLRAQEGTTERAWPVNSHWVHGPTDLDWSTVVASIESEAARATAAEALLVPLTQKGAVNGVATLDGTGRLPGSQAPLLAIGETFPVASQAAMLALTAQRGDLAIRTDLDPDGVFWLATDDPTQLVNWIRIGAVDLTVDGAAGVPSLRTLGTGATQAAAGNDARLSDVRVPTDLSVTTGKIVDGAVTAAKVAADVATQAELDGAIAALSATYAQPTPPRLKAARSALATRTLNTVFIGTSITEGAFATAVENRYQDKFIARMRATYQPVGVWGSGGYKPASSTVLGSWTLAGGAAFLSQAFGLGIRSIRLDGAGETATATIPVGCTAVDLWYTQAPGGAVLSWAVDGGAATNFSTVDAATVGGRKVRITGWDTGRTHSLVVAFVSGALGVFEGAYLFGGDESAGIRGFDSGHSGGVVATFAVPPPAGGWIDGVVAADPHLIVIELGVNDWHTGISSATFATQLAALVAALRAPFTVPPSILLLAYWQCVPLASTEPWSNYVAAMRALVSTANDVDLVDLYATFGVADSALTDKFGLNFVDYLHPSDKGHAVIADLLFDHVRTAA